MSQARHVQNSNSILTKIVSLGQAHAQSVSCHIFWLKIHSAACTVDQFHSQVWPERELS